MKRASLRLYSQRGGWKESQYERCTGHFVFLFIYKKAKIKDDGAVFNLGS
jgi:hypothetical protein